MRIIYILIICSLIGTIALWLGHFGKITKRTAVLTCLASLSIAGVLLLLAVLPGNSFYGKVLTHAQNTQGRKLIALTFDDGPYPPYTQKLLALLEQKNVHATFFMVGENAAKHPDIVRKVQVQGHQIALHAGRHQDLLKLNAEEAASNIAYGKTTLESITHKPVRYMRPPHGFKDWSVVQAINESNLTIVNWSIIPRDWTNPGAQVIADRVCEAAAPAPLCCCMTVTAPKCKHHAIKLLKQQALSLIHCGRRDTNS